MAGRRYALPLTWLVSAAAAVAVALPAVWWSPLNVDEELTLEIADASLRTIVDTVWGGRGGGPVHFLLEHATLSWPGGLEGLRLPSLVFLLAALPAAALLGRELCGRDESLLVVPALALAPLAVAYSTFGRPHVLLLATFLWTLVAALRAARTAHRTRWAAAGALLGALVYVHPTAPLYAGVALAAALIHARLPPRRLALVAWPAPLAFALVSLPYWWHALDVLRDRYGVEASAGRGRTFTGDPVYVSAAQAIAPAGHVVNVFTVFAAVGLVALFRRRPRSAVILALAVLAPVVFFSIVPAGARSAVFFGRYMLPALPAFLLLVCAGCTALARFARGGLGLALVVLAPLLALEAHADVARLAKLHELGVARAARALAPYDEQGTLFATSGVVGERRELARLTRGRPPRLLAGYAALELPRLRVVDDASCRALDSYLRNTRSSTTGLWLFYAGTGGDARRGRAATGGVAGADADVVATSYVLARSAEPRRARSLVALGLRIRSAWRRAVPADTGAGAPIRCARRALRKRRP